MKTYLIIDTKLNLHTNGVLVSNRAMTVPFKVIRNLTLYSLMQWTYVKSGCVSVCWAEMVGYRQKRRVMVKGFCIILAIKLNKELATFENKI